MRSLKNKTVFITGASRGIGRAIALRCAQEGANVVIAAKSTVPHPKLEGTIHTVAAEVEAFGGKALAIKVDVRDEEQVSQAVQQAVEHFGGIDVLVNNASAIQLSPTLETSMKRFDLMFGVNVRGTFLCSQACLPHLLKSDNPHILTLSPPLNFDAKWFKNHLAYSISKFDMSLCTLGLAAEFKKQGIAVNSLWPRTTIATAAIEVHFPEEIYQASRKPEIMSDAAFHILTQDSKTTTGQFFIDEDLLRETGIEDFSQYAIDPSVEPFLDLFV